MLERNLLLCSICVVCALPGCGAKLAWEANRVPFPALPEADVDPKADPFVGLTKVSEGTKENEADKVADFGPSWASAKSGVTTGQVSYRRAPPQVDDRPEDKQTGLVVIYSDVPQSDEKDRRSSVERMWAPWGFMPASRVDQIAVSDNRLIDSNDQ
jgi:hypothetical protein